MNKDVIYIEPEDDITDIITKIENAKEKIVALVLPKNAEIFRSVVNMKLISKSGLKSDKNLVLVTTDSTVLKLAATQKMLVTKDLKTVPSIPKLDDKDIIKETVVVEESVEVKDGEEETTAEESSDKKDEETAETTEKDDQEEQVEQEEQDKKEPEEKDSKKADKKAKKSGKGAKDGNWFKRHKIIIIISPFVLIALGLVLFWAFAIAPAVKIAISIRAVKNNFSENVTFTTKLEEEDAKAGKFYLEEKKSETPVKVEFKATGTKNIGEKATGEVVAYTYFKKSGSIKIDAGASFSINGLFFTSTKDAVLSWNGKPTACGNYSEDSIEDVIEDGCLVTTEVSIVANGSGSSYNIAPADGWSTNVAGIRVYSVTETSGGTDRTVTVVQQSDIDAVRSQISTPANEVENRKALLDNISDDTYKIESSFRQTTSDIVTSPKLDEVVEDGVTPTASATITASIYTIDLVKVKEYIKETASVSDNDLIYSIDNPFVESFTSIENGYAGRLKTVYTVGPNISAESVLESVKGELIGKIKPLLLDAGAREVTIERSVPWVTSVPNDPNKIDITITTEE